ncbi:MAG TPA: alkaline phosphatase D family protein [Blastocatellia bacterium]|nr:alkaline phosphatase D family protein [Blastocatellia bacterium]
MKRRAFLSLAATTGLSTLWSNPLKAAAPAIIISDKIRPQIPFGAQCGDLAADRAMIWSRSDRAARMIVEYSTTESFQNARRVAGPAALEPTDFTARVDLTELPAGQKIFYRVTFQSLDDAKVFSEPVAGSFLTPPNTKRDVSFVWGGDVCGQGWGINPEFGGMKIYEAMRRMQPDLFIHSGDAIYADGVIQAEVKLDDGSIWKNLTTPEKSKVAETLEEFRGNYRYNLMDENLRRFNSEIPMMAQWDDHETRNNWYPGQILEDDRYVVKSVDLLSARAKRAFLDYTPIRFDATDPERIYRVFGYGPLLDIFMLDERSYRGPNTPNRQTAASDETAFLGGAQMAWIKQRLLASKARWKVIASDMPIGIIVKDGAANFEAFANGNGPALGRELELAELLRFIKQKKIKNVVWITTDVHYCAAHYYNPVKAQFTDFDPFWEFIAGPLNAGTFGPTGMDDTFGPDVKFIGVPKDVKPNRSPKDGLQFFGAVKIDGKTEAMTVGLRDIDGKKLFSVDLPPGK